MLHFAGGEANTQINQRRAEPKISLARGTPKGTGTTTIPFLQNMIF